MDWIKANYEKALLGLFALALVVVSAFLILNARGFQDTFASIRGQVVRSTKIEPLDTSIIDQAEAALQKPTVWTPKPGAGSLFASRKYIVKDGQLNDPSDPTGPQLHPPVPNSWFIDNDLDYLDPDVLAQDPDSDGFSNLDEFQAKSDPNDKNSHPKYNTKLRLERFIKQPFRLLFASWDGDPAKPDSLTFQLNTVDVRQPTQFLKMNDPIANTKFKITNFKLNKMTDPNGVEKDVSELTVQNTETAAEVVLVMGKIVDSPDSYALFKYLWNGEQIKVKKDITFVLKPENEEYKLIDITDAEALIEAVKTHEKVKVPRGQ